MEESKKLNRESMKPVSGGDWELMSMACPLCGEWNGDEIYDAPNRYDPVVSVVVTFHCSNCGCTYKGSFLIKAQ